MSIDEAITHCLEVADGQTAQGKCPECAMEHRQLAEWLTDYKRLKEQSGDTISKQVVLEVLKDKWNAFSDANDAMQESIDTIEVLPPVNPQRTGHWIEDDITERSKSAYKHKCDRCGAYHRAMYDYCPSCGAKMYEPQERSDKE